MKMKAIIASLFTMSILAGCGFNNNNNNMDDTALRNRDTNDLTRVNNPGTRDFNVFDDRNTRNTDITPVRNNNNNNNGQNDNSRMRVADRAADKIVSLPEVDHANVIVTDNNAYVAARLVNNQNGLTRDIERKISEQVKSVDRDINDVYVSVNPDFYDRMNNYSNDIRNGQPIEGFFNEFTNSVRRVFPTQFNQ
ncbi:YhcN/YlaJ family sporulation lipoprotein [Bacillus sp. DTU_2020_1000418_1_SI_GHA_SEK_038]|uniref:YhcN/YlaJ family sporulation lipoprotein n=1 Tax=Bacillus sp. DTU_2020_1000418_1_SI_GHA_SEK_038 TaxID=3077585 RepID=UPI0028F12C6D|nr:YhcN/YlaJ family sporulation lipoprotein [Bacillus sp. DTU_2020_1000418_1_SI_GHA_SEK_038]WNS73517.1 YhcN/YlaJ family sporulation lipoprotein [Bacillus sp. DTU_2020_1000418_1_SI_GHA_SEK_038]